MTGQPAATPTAAGAIAVAVAVAVAVVAADDVGCNSNMLL